MSVCVSQRATVGTVRVNGTTMKARRRENITPLAILRARERSLGVIPLNTEKKNEGGGSCRQSVMRAIEKVVTQVSIRASKDEMCIDSDKQS